MRTRYTENNFKKLLEIKNPTKELKDNTEEISQEEPKKTNR